MRPLSMLANAESKSIRSWTPIDWIVTPSLVAASCDSRARSVMLGLVSFQSMATRDVLGAISLSISSRLAANSVASNETPVAFSGWTGKTRYNSGPNRVSHGRENDWDRRGRFLCGDYSRRAERMEHIHFQGGELQGQFGKSSKISLRPSNLEHEVASFAVAQFP